MRYGFQQQLKVGHNGEKKFQRLYPELKRTDGKVVDFISPEGMKIELKTDTYDTGNFFIERYSDYMKQTVGGPWQTQSKGGDTYVYMFEAYSTIYWFEVNALVEFMDEWINNLTQKGHDKHFKTVRQRGAKYKTGGYIIPIEELKHLAFKVEEINDTIKS
jgi:predicted aminopeptidase|tara:strand:+ start:3195 stop:3674 length:480 start_codon:yes stop_codon:yes gene_type:complete